MLGMQGAQRGAGSPPLCATLHTDATGNTHRREISFDKFWSGAFDGGCRGLIEFRALETLPRSSWMSAVALLWRALAVMLLDWPKQPALIDFASVLHESYFLPSVLWADLRAVLADLRKAGLPLPDETFRRGRKGSGSNS